MCCFKGTHAPNVIGSINYLLALSAIAKVWKEPTCPLMDKWIKKMWYTYTMAYYSPIKKNEILPFSTTWIKLECIMLREISQAEGNKVRQRFHSYVEFKKHNR